MEEHDAALTAAAELAAPLMLPASMSPPRPLAPADGTSAAAATIPLLFPSLADIWARRARAAERLAQAFDNDPPSASEAVLAAGAVQVADALLAIVASRLAAPQDKASAADLLCVLLAAERPSARCGLLLCPRAAVDRLYRMAALASSSSSAAAAADEEDGGAATTSADAASASATAVAAARALLKHAACGHKHRAVVSERVGGD